MGMDLVSESGTEMRFSGPGWALVLNIAEAYGWIPAGTLPPVDWNEPGVWADADGVDELGEWDEFGEWDESDEWEERGEADEPDEGDEPDDGDEPGDPSERGEWPGNYDSNEGQIVTAVDARCLAESLD